MQSFSIAELEKSGEGEGESGLLKAGWSRLLERGSSQKTRACTHQQNGQ